MQDFDFTKEIAEYLLQMSEEERECNTCGYITSKEHAESIMKEMRKSVDESVREKLDLLEWENIQMQLEIEDYMFIKGATWCFNLLTDKNKKV